MRHSEADSPPDLWQTINDSQPRLAGGAGSGPARAQFGCTPLTPASRDDNSDTGKDLKACEDQPITTRALGSLVGLRAGRPLPRSDKSKLSWRNLRRLVLDPALSGYPYKRIGRNRDGAVGAPPAEGQRYESASPRKTLAWSPRRNRRENSGLPE